MPRAGQRTLSKVAFIVGDSSPQNPGYQPESDSQPESEYESDSQTESENDAAARRPPADFFFTGLLAGFAGRFFLRSALPMAPVMRTRRPVAGLVVL